jgi:hypothetical protein
MGVSDKFHTIATTRFPCISVSRLASNGEKFIMAQGATEPKSAYGFQVFFF